MASSGVVVDCVVCVAILGRLVGTVLIVVIISVEGVDTAGVVALGMVTKVEPGVAAEVASTVGTSVLPGVVSDGGPALVVGLIAGSVVGLTSRVVLCVKALCVVS